jgi:hypothetical protein
MWVGTATESLGLASKNRERFVALAEKRVTRAMKDIRLVGNLSNRTNYSYTPEDVRKIVVALEAEIRKLKLRFDSQSSADGALFKL